MVEVFSQVMPIRPQFVKLEALGRELEAAENKRQSVLTFMELAPCICFMKNADTGRYEFISQTGCEAMGKTEHEIIGHTDWELFPEELAKQMIGHDLKVLKSREPVKTIEARAFNSDGAVSLYLVSKFLVINGHESIGGIAVEIPDTFKLESKTSMGTV